jgi:hypothetical protein
LQKFYESIIDLADSFAEAYQGRHGLMGPISLQSAKKTTNVIDFLQNQLEEIEADRYKVCEESDSAIQPCINYAF